MPQIIGFCSSHFIRRNCFFIIQLEFINHPIHPTMDTV
ncbi:MAG: hypothetical protein OJF59_001484 [Cytophagales bacterium]|nr:MAG: hypothetical protein OJF59_001484 [Cytophagales bacterium]